MTVYCPIHLCYNMFLARTGIAVNLQPWYRLHDIEAKNIGTCGMFLREPSCHMGSLHLSSAYILPFAPSAGINAPFAKCLVWALKPSLGVGHPGWGGKDMYINIYLYMCWHHKAHVNSETWGWLTIWFVREPAFPLVWLLLRLICQATF